MALYYLPLLIRSDRYYVAKMDNDAETGNRESVDFNFVTPADDRVLTPLISIEDPSKVVLNQMAPSDRQDILLRECSVSLIKQGDDFELQIRRTGTFSVSPFNDEQSGVRLDYSNAQKRITLGYYHHRIPQTSFHIYVTLYLSETESYSGKFLFTVAPSRNCQRVVIDFGSEASQLGYKNCGPQSAIVNYDILENVISQLSVQDRTKNWRREEFLNHEPGQPSLYRSFYAVRKNMNEEQRQHFPFNFTDDLDDDEIRLFITRAEVAATEVDFRDNYEIIPNLKLGIEKSLQLVLGHYTEDYSIRTHKKELISGILLRMIRLMLRTKPDFRQAGIIVTLLVPNIYTQHDVFELLNELRDRTPALLESLRIPVSQLSLEFETISESDAAFMGYQQTHSSEVSLQNGDMALVIDCGKGTTDISMLISDDNQNYSSFFRTGFAGAGNVLSYGFVEDFLTVVLRAIPGSNEVSVRDFIVKQMLDQNLTVDVMNFLQWIETQKKKYSSQPPVSLHAFAALTESSLSTERSIGNLYKDQSTLLQYAEAILKDRNIRWDDEVTGLINKAIDAIVSCIAGSIRDVLTRDIKKRIKMVMLSGRAFYFDELRLRTEKELRILLGSQVRIHTVPTGRAVNNKNIAVHGAFSGAYKITDFTGIPIDKKEGLSKNNDVLNNNVYLYRGIKVEPDNDILYNTSIVRRNNQQLKAFKGKAMDIYFTRDNIYLRVMENQQVKDVRSLFGILSAGSEAYSAIRDLKAISMFPAYNGELASINAVYQDIIGEKKASAESTEKRKSGIFQFFQF